jgi:hypothetical protein
MISVEDYGCDYSLRHYIAGSFELAAVDRLVVEGNQNYRIHPERGPRGRYTEHSVQSDIDPLECHSELMMGW